MDFLYGTGTKGTGTKGTDVGGTYSTYSTYGIFDITRMRSVRMKWALKVRLIFLDETSNLL